MRELCKKGEGTLMVLDLDNFKPVNDIYGHDTGDVVLKKFAYLIKDGCDDNDVLCRIGGDEFLVLTREEMTKEKIAAFSTKLNTRIVEECVDIMGKDFNVPIGVSSGVISLTHSKEYDTLFKLADKELYRVKQNGKHGYGVFDPDKQNNDEELISAQTALDRMNILCAERGESDCAMVVGQDSFISISRFMDRYVRINKESFIRLVFSVFTDDVSDRDEAVVLFQSVIENTFSRNDVVMKDNTDCFYLILPKHDASDMDNIIKRVMDNWEQTRFFDSTRIDYAYEVVKYKE
jgi:diguanylate cyclase (GGDEF)-like protein